MSHVFQHTMRSLERDVVLKDLWKNFKTWHNGVTAVPWYNLYITINNIFLSEKKLQFSYSIFILIAICSRSTDHQHTNYVYTTNIFSQFICLIQSFKCQQNIKAWRGSGIRQDSLGDEDLNYCHRCPTKTALCCFSSLCLFVNVSECHNL